MAGLFSAPAGAQVMLQSAVVTPSAGYATNGQTQMQASVAQPVAGIATNGTTIGSFGFFTPTAPAAGVHTAIASTLAMSVWPNPATSNVQIGMTLAQTGPVTVMLYDEAGRLVAERSLGIHAAGRLTTSLDVSGLTSGSYTAAISIPGEIAQERITVVR